jgi:uncharacterized membrane protein
MDESRSVFLAVAFEDAASAENALGAVTQSEHQKGVTDAAVVVHTEADRIELLQTKELAAGEGVVAGGAVGIIAGVLLGIPVGGALVGLVGGAGLGMRDTGIPNDRLRRLGEGLGPGHALLCVLVDHDAAPGMRAALEPYGEVLDAELVPAADP